MANIRVGLGAVGGELAILQVIIAKKSDMHRSERKFRAAVAPDGLLECSRARILFPIGACLTFFFLQYSRMCADFGWVCSLRPIKLSFMSYMAS